MQLKINFYCRQAKAGKKTGKAPVEMSVSYSGRELIVLPIDCVPSEFRGEYDNPNSHLRVYCDSCETRMRRIYTQLTMNGELVTPKILKDIYLNGTRKNVYLLRDLSKDFYDLRKCDNEAQTMRKYVMAFDEFLAWNRLSPDDEITKVQPAHVQFYFAQVKLKYQPNTWIKRMKNIKAYFNYAFQNGKITRHPFAGLRLSAPKSEMPYLTYEEVMQIKNATITDDRLDRVRDLFLFQCFSGLAYIDMCHLEVNDFKTNAKYNQMYIQKLRWKTNIQYTSILYEDAVDIAMFYQFRLPVISNQKYNQYLKEVGTIARVTKNLTSHVGRHTYAVYLLSHLQLPVEIVQKQLGHTNIRQTQAYAKMLDDSVFKASKTTAAVDQETITAAEIIRLILGD